MDENKFLFNQYIDFHNKYVKKYGTDTVVLLQNGSHFNSSLLRTDRETLLKLGYFKSVSPPRLSQGSKENSIVVSFDMLEQVTRKISVGLEQDRDLYFGFLNP